MKNSKQTIKIMMALLCSAIFVENTSAQTEEDTVKATIMTMFDGMRAGESTMVHSAFGADPVMRTIGPDRATGKVVVKESPLEG